MIYIEEAHATDEWPIGYSAGVLNRKHQTLEDRRNCAMQMINEYDFEIPVFIDSMDNKFQNTYSCWPFRCIIIDNNKTIQYISKPNNAEYDFMELYNYLEKINMK